MMRRDMGLRPLLRSLLRFWRVNLLCVIGLSIGFAAALIISLDVRQELDFNRFLPDADRILVLTDVYSPPDSPPVAKDVTPAGMAEWLRQDAPAVAAVARLDADEWSVRTNRFQSLEPFYWTDPNFFDIVRLKAVAGDPKTALDAPYTAVLTQKLARRYFGRENVVGETLYLQGVSPVKVTAVLADLPANTDLDRGLFVSGLTSYGMLHLHDINPSWQWASAYTFLRLKPGARLTAEDVLKVAARHWHNPFSLPAAFKLVRFPDLHFEPEADAQMAPRGHRDTVTGMTVVAVLIIGLAAINLAALMAAQVEERRAEIAVRKILGARAADIVVLLLCETALVSLLSLLCALSIAEWTLPFINQWLKLDLSLWSAAAFTGRVAALVVLAGTLAGLYPAIVLAKASPTPVPDTRSRHMAASDMRRIGWIAVQISLLVMLLTSSQIIYRQWRYATGPALNFDGTHLLQVVTFDTRREAEFKKGVLALDQVSGAAYSRFIPEQRDIRLGWAPSRSGGTVQFIRQSVDTDFFRLFGIRLLAGRNFSGVYDSDTPPAEVILSRSAAQALGYPHPEDAVNRVLNYQADHMARQATIIGVVDDMRVASVREPLQPAVFDNEASIFTRLNIRLKPGGENTALPAIERLWDQYYPKISPIDRHFYTDYLNGLYGDMERQWWTFGLLSIVGVCLAILGLSGLSMYLARMHLREMAIRNALGARTRDIVWLRIRPFITPLIVGGLAGCVLAWIAMSWWLSTFAAHVAIGPTPFAIACGLTALTTVATLSAHSLLTSPARSSHPLRHG
jgi:putative ABC transport system permease protein